MPEMRMMITPVTASAWGNQAINLRIHKSITQIIFTRSNINKLNISSFFNNGNNNCKCRIIFIRRIIVNHRKRIISDLDMVSSTTT